MPCCARRRPRARVVLVGGVPGAGKTTAITQVAAATPSVDALDLRNVSGRAQPDAAGGGRSTRRTGPWCTPCTRSECCSLPLRGPFPAGPWWSRPGDPTAAARWFARLARLRGWDPVLVYVDVPRALAETGQVLRGRVVDPVSFAGHWARWEALRAQVTGAADELDGARWSEVVLTDRAGAADALRQIAGVPALLWRGRCLRSC